MGIACGGGLYFAASFSTALNLLLLRFGPRLFQEGADEPNTNGLSNNMSSPTSQMGGSNINEWKNLVDKDIESGKSDSYGGIETIQASKCGVDRASLYARQASIRNRPTLM